MNRIQDLPPSLSRFFKTDATFQGSDLSIGQRISKDLLWKNSGNVEQLFDRYYRAINVWVTAFAAGVILSLGVFGSTPAAAQSTWVPTAASGTWCTWTGDGSNGCFETPTEACAKQYSEFGGSGTFYGASPNAGSWVVQSCNWQYTFGASYPATVSFHCPSGYIATAERCVQEDPPNCDCGASSESSPSTAHPINILTGSKRFDARDFATEDGALTLDRTFVSRPFGGQGLQMGGVVRSFGNWMAGFDIQLQLTSQGWDVGKTVVILSPTGSARNFQRQSDGSMLEYSYEDRITRLQFVGTWPSDPTTLAHTQSTWTYTDESNNIWTFQTFAQGTEYRRGRPISVKRSDGTILTYAYDTYGALSSITDQAGKAISFMWNTANGSPVSISKVSLPGGYSIKYYYETVTGAPSLISDARLSKVEYLDAANVVQDSVSYGYDNPSYRTFVTSIFDKNLTLRWKVTYDDDGRATRSEGPNGEYLESIAYSFTSTSSTRVRTDALGRQTTYSFSHPSGVFHTIKLDTIQQAATINAPASTSSNTYSGNYIGTHTDENGTVTVYTRNTAGQPTQIVEGSGTSSARTTGLTWATNFNLPIQSAEAGLTTNYNYDGQARLMSVSQVDTTSQTVPYSTNGQTRIWTYTWGATAGANGKITSIDGPLPGTGDTTSFAYNSNGYLASVTDEVGKTTTVTAWDWRGAPLTVVDPNSVTTTFTYDIHGRPLTATINPGTAQKQYGFTYDAVGNLAQVTLPTGGYLHYTYDSASRLTQISNDKGETITLTPNNVGDPTLITTKSAGGIITQQQSVVYDELGRVIQTLGAASTTPTKMGYDKVGNLTTLTDGRSKISTNTFDALDRVTQIKNPENETITLAYNAVDAVTSHKDGRNLETTFVTNGFGDVIRELSPDRGTRTYWYDLAGHMTKLIDGDGEETDFAYDNSGRLLSKTFLGASWETVTYTYDSVASGNKGNGRLTSVTEQSGSTAFTYDVFGRVIDDAKVIQGTTYTVAYTYDKNDKVSSLTLPSGRVVTYTRDNDGLITAVTTKPSATGTTSIVATSVTHAPFGPLTGLIYGNGLTLSRTYNANYWLTRTQVKNGATALFDLSYDYYDDGRLGEIDDNAATGRTVYMSLSDSGRLTYANGPWGQDSYSWDESGNRIGEYLTVGGVTTSDNEITSGSSNRLVKTADNVGATKRTLAYRDGGDLYTDTSSGGPTYTYAYSARKRLVQIKQGAATVATYGYDFRDQRVWRSVTGVTPIHYIFDEDGHLLAEQNGNTGAVVREYIWIDDMPIAVVDSSSGTATTYYIHTGHLEEPQVMTSASKAKVWDAYITPFGKAKVFTTASANIDMRLPGQWFQVEAAGAGLNQNGYRDYDPSLGRYIEADPIGLAGGQNPYTYVDGQVYDWTDRKGLDAIVVFRSLDGANGAVADHEAMYVGNDRTGYRYMSKDGVVGDHSKFAGPADFSDRHVNNLQDVLRDARSKGYEAGYLHSANAQQDVAMISQMLKSGHRRYNFLASNCGQAVSTALDSAGLNGGHSFDPKLNRAFIMMWKDKFGWKKVF